jgi:HK97 family phage portal protein
MGLLSLARKENRDSLNGATALHPKDPALADLWGGGNNSASGQNVTPDTALRVSAVYACVSFRAETLAMLPKLILENRPDGGHNKLVNHRLYKQLHNRPNRWQSSFEFFEMMQGHVDLRGNAYAQIVAYPGRGINELVPMHPDRVWPFIITPNGATYYMYDTSPMPPAGSKLYYQHFPINGPTEILLADEVLHIRDYSINGIIGLSKVRKVALEAIGFAMAAEQTGARLFANGAQISKVFRHPAKMTDAVYGRMKDQLDKYSGSPNAGKTIILEEGMDISSLSMTMTDAQYLETRKFEIEDIARIFRVPLQLIGHGDKAPTYASAEQFLIQVKTFTVQPLVVRWEDAMERDLLYPGEINNIEIEIDMDDLLRGDIVARANYLKSRFSMASISPNQIRLFEHENPSTEEGSDKTYIMSNMVPLSRAGIRVSETIDKSTQVKGKEKDKQAEGNI